MGLNSPLMVSNHGSKGGGGGLSSFGGFTCTYVSSPSGAPMEGNSERLHPAG